MPAMISSVEVEPFFSTMHQHRAVAVDVHDVGLRRVAVAHVRDVADIDHRAVDRLDRQVAELVDVGRRVVELDRVFEAADLLRADRRDQVLRGERVGDVLAGQAARLHRGRIEVDLHLALSCRRTGTGWRRPARVTSGVRTTLRPRSARFCSDSPSPDSASWMIGTVEAL